MRLGHALQLRPVGRHHVFVGGYHGLAVLQRAHQIRVQHAARGLPLWGDARYGNGRPGENIALWAWRLTVEHPTRKIPCVFEALPDGAAPWPLFAREIKELKNEG